MRLVTVTLHLGDQHNLNVERHYTTRHDRTKEEEQTNKSKPHDTQKAGVCGGTKEAWNGYTSGIFAYWDWASCV